MAPKTKIEQTEESIKIATATMAAVLASDIHHIQLDILEIKNSLGKDITEIKTTLEKNYITKAEFRPVQKVVYGLVGAILLAVVGELLALVIVR